MVSTSCGRLPSEFSLPERSNSIPEKTAEKQKLPTKISLPNGFTAKHLRLGKWGIPETAAVIPEASVLASKRSSRDSKSFQSKLHEYIDFLPFINILIAELYVLSCCISRNPSKCIHAYPGDIAVLVPDHCNKVSITIK